MQQTIAKPVSIAGTGLHSGAPVRLVLCPAAADHGVTFVRVDIEQGDNLIAVHPKNWVEASLCTVLRNSDGASVSTIEHLLAALHGCGIHNLRVEIDGPEVPILDGSSAPFVARILAAGLAECDAPVRVLRVLRPVSVERDGARASLAPSDGFELSFEIDFADQAIGYQSRSLQMYNGAFLRELSDCRTFCMRADVEVMQANGLALGGTLDNAVVFDSGTVLTPGGLRRADEPVRHKMLDAMGDLYVAGHPIIGRYEGVKAGHALTGLLVQALFADARNYEIVACDARCSARLPGANISRKDMQLSA
ncbi:MAG: UDP-3-O-acyl-N-acetylglucosamine deacetylase [Rhodobacteraceae bacterium]|nr:UDP-3-O-acyl-N-acetylglucosamine deacetylase [Paracoccaceae bacterium]